MRAQCLSIDALCAAERLPAVDAVILLRALGVIAESVPAGEVCIPPGPADGIMRKVLTSFLVPGGESSWAPSDLVALRDAILLTPSLRGPRQAPSVGVCDVDTAALDAVEDLRGLVPVPEPGRITLPLRRVPTRIRCAVIRSVLEGHLKPVRMGPRPNGNLLDLCVAFDGLP
ncbi:hypothetical protein [uncultured Aureimonas sp.]|uniref:hypothetical protein n=1 Tax=uncultured Aureimonas sp. TaxID=1604662 RepID=UPI0025D51FEF|nr:hypothetical protein [uncultured Aureimonas sp.]